MRRTLLPLLFGLGLSLSAAACGDDEASVANCGPGTHVENGVCVPDQVQDTFTGQDTLSQPDTSTTPTDTLVVTQDTGPFDTSGGTDTLVDPNSCTTEEAGSRPLGAGCSKDCQCAKEFDLFCYDGPYMQGFRFCTRNGLGAGTGKPDAWIFTSTNNACPGWENSTPSDDKVYVLACETLDECKAVSSQYTHCGTTGVFGPAGAKDTRCCGDATIATRKTCLVIDTPPFNNCD